MGLVIVNSFCLDLYHKTLLWGAIGAMLLTCYHNFIILFLLAEIFTISKVRRRDKSEIYMKETDNYSQLY